MKETTPKTADSTAQPATPGEASAKSAAGQKPKEFAPKEFGGPSGPEPTRYGDWERNGRATDF